MTIQKKWKLLENSWKLYTNWHCFLRNAFCFKKYILLILVDTLCFPCPYWLTMTTKLEINICTIWDIFKAEIVPEVPGGKLISKSRWGEDEKRGKFFLISLGETKRGRGGGGNWLFTPFREGSMLAAMHRKVSSLSYEIDMLKIS